MRIRNIKDDYDFLKKISKKVDVKKDNLDKIINDLKEYCVNNEVFALASIQLGYDKRIIYIKNTSLNDYDDTSLDENIVLINPVIKKREGIALFWECCASCFDNMGCMLRPYKVVINYTGIDKKRHQRTFKGFKAVIISHEYDHLDGILHINNALKVYNMKEEDRKKFRLEHPYQIINNIGNYSKLYKKYCKKFDNSTDNIIL